MSPDQDREDPAQELAMQAAWDWVMKAHEQPLSDAEHEALARWLEADPRHRNAHAQASRLWLLSGLVPPAHDDDGLPH
jgi:ferric-dicitrate binding protein FerR (iron transport regulator)